MSTGLETRKGRRRKVVKEKKKAIARKGRKSFFFMGRDISFDQK
jgi:hypothetical protein